MSGWSDYGFPDISGIHVQTALEGLVSALDERTYAFAGVKYSFRYPDPIRDGDAVPISDVMQHIENNLQFLETSQGNSTLILPDGTPFSRSAAASYLGEELISVPTWGRGVGYDWSDPFPAIGYDWMMQRFRIINLIYRAKHEAVNGSIHGSEPFDCYGETIAKAVEEANRFWSVRSYNYEHLFTLYGIIRTETDPSWGVPPGSTPYKIRRSLALPTKFIYPLYVPAVLTLEGTASAGGTFNDFGLGLTEGENIVPVTVPADVSYMTPIEFDTTAAIERFCSTVPASVGNTGFEFDGVFFTDLRPSLEFYDPIEGE